MWGPLGTGWVGGTEDEAAVAGGCEHSGAALGLERRRGWFGDEEHEFGLNRLRLGSQRTNTQVESVTESFRSHVLPGVGIPFLFPVSTGRGIIPRQHPSTGLKT